MDQVVIVTDSVACLPPGTAEEYGILTIPLSVIIGDKVYQDGIDITPAQVYELQRHRRILPTTSAASPGEVLQIYRAASQRAKAIMHLSVAAKLSMAFDAALRAKELAREALPHVELEVVDTQTAAGAQGFLVAAAARVAAAGGSLSQAIQAVRQLAPKIHLILAIDTLYFLAKGGRVPRAAAWAGSVLSVKPILQVAAGEVTPLERIRTKPRALQRLLDLMEERAGRQAMHVNLMHAGVPQEAEELRDRVAARFDCSELCITEFTPVMGAHTGPGLLGLAFFSEESPQGR